MEQIKSVDFYAPTPKDTPVNETIQIPAQTSKPILSNSCLYKMFASLINRRHVDLLPPVAEHILLHDLNVPYDKQEVALQKILRDCLAYFVLVWPGWKSSMDYFNGKVSYLVWFGQFRQYLMDEIGEVVENQEKYKTEAMKVDGNDGKESVDKGVETEGDLSQESAVTLEISGPPRLLNSLVFYDSDCKDCFEFNSVVNFCVIYVCFR